MSSSNISNKDLIDSLAYIGRWADTLRQALEARQARDPNTMFLEGITIGPIGPIPPVLQIGICDDTEDERS